MLTIKDIECPYETRSKELFYLRSINISLEANTVFGIIGRTGAGKSTLLRCVGLLETPTTGIVSIDEKNLTILAGKERRAAYKNIAYIRSKNDFMHSKTVYENIILPLQFRDAVEQNVVNIENVIELTNLKDKIDLRPDQLSPLNKLRMLLARSLIGNPKILLLDDVTSGIDSKSVQHFVNNLKNVINHYHLAVLMVTNDVEILKTLCNKVGVMHQGELIEQCSPLELFTNPTSEIAKDFIRASSKHEIPWVYRRKMRATPQKEHNPIARICFTDCLSPESLLTKCIETYQLRVSIIQGHQEVIGDTLVNILIIELKGQEENIEIALSSLKQYNLHFEILGYVAIN